MAITTSPASRSNEPIDLSHVAGSGIDQQAEIAYIYLNKPTFNLLVEMLYMDSLSRVDEYRKLLANDHCVREIIDLSILIDRLGERTTSMSISYKNLRRLLAEFVNESITDDVQPKFPFEFITPVTTHRSAHRAVVAALFCDFLADIVALRDACGWGKEADTLIKSSPKSSLPPTSSPSVVVRSGLSLAEYARRRKETGGKDAGRHAEAQVAKEAGQDSAFDPRAQQKAKVTQEKSVKEAGAGRWAGHPPF